MKSLTLIQYIFLLFVLFGVILHISAQDCSPDKDGNVTCKDFNANATLNIDSRIQSKHNAAANMPVFTKQDHYNGKYTRNLNCWAYNLDITCASPWNSKGINLRAGTLITPRHAILAAHYNIQTGDSIRFITKDNVVVRRKVIAFTNNTDWNSTYPDIEVVTLDSDVPPSIPPCQLLPSNAANYIADNGKGLPGFFLDQDEKAIVADVLSLGLSNNQNYEFNAPTLANRVSLYEPIAMGDSGDPVFLVLSGKLVLVGVVTSYGPWGYSLNFFANLAVDGTKPLQRIDDLIKETDALAGINTGYKVSFFDFEAITAVNETMLTSCKVFVTGKTLKVELAENTIGSIEVYDMFGRLVIRCDSKIDGFEHKLSVSGLYVVKVSTGNERQVFKVMLN